LGSGSGLVEGSQVNAGDDNTAYLLGRKYGALLLLGSLGVSVLALVFGVLPGAGKRRASRDTTCPFGVESVKVEAMVCRHCGRDIPSRPPAAT
jgi:hypothetical protein